MRKRNIKARFLSVALSTALVFSSFLPVNLGLNLFTPIVAEAAESSTVGDYGLADTITDGNILHCFCWKYTDITAMLPEIAESGFTSVQVSPPQPTSGTGSWWWFYQPLGFYIGSSELGNKAELQELCTEAEKYGIKVIADIVANHLAGDHTNIQSDLKDSQYWHPDIGASEDGNRYKVTHGTIGMPDLNTEHSYVQQKVSEYVKELESIGVDGIRWDAAKHIGLPSEGDNFWPTVTSATDLWHYGEILNNPGVDAYGSQGTAILKEYSQYIAITDSKYGKTIRESFYSGTAPSGYGDWCTLGLSNDKLVYWGESHDTWSNNQDWGYSNHMSQNVIDRAYAVAASRNGITALYFSRPSTAVKDNIKIGVKGSTHFTSKEVAEVNKFKNAMIGQPDYYTASNNCSVVTREKGAVVVAGSGSNKSVTVTNGGGLMEPGTYIDQVSGSTWNVTSTTISGTIGSTGIAVIYNPENVTKTPTPTISQEGGNFSSETLSLTLGLKNATSGTYKIGNGTATTYTGTKSIAIGSDMAYGDSVTVTLTATNGTDTTTKTYTFTKKEVTGNVAYLSLPSGWKEPVYCYAYDSATETVNNGTWPGKQMTKDSATGYYMYEIPENIEAPRVIFYSSDTNRTPADMVKGYLFETEGSYLYKDGSWKVYEEPVTEGKVVVKYVDESGASIATSKTLTGEIGSSYTTSAVTISGYTLTDTPDNAKGTYTKATITVTYVYAEKGGEPKVTSSVSTGSSFKTETKEITLTLSNAKSGTYSVDGGPTKTFTGSAKVVLGRGKVADSTVTVKATAVGSDGTTKNFTFTYEKQFNGTVNEVTDTASASLAKTASTTVAASQGLSSYYSTNGKGFGKTATITIDGDFSDWSEDMIIAQGAAWDVANHYKGGHENCVLDTYSLYAAWDNDNLYIGWQMVNTTDTWARSGDGPLSDGGRVLDVPLILALSVNPNSTSMSNKNTAGGPIWGQKMGLEFDTHVDHLLYMSGKPGLGKPSLFKAVDAAGNTDYENGCIGFTEGGIEYDMAEGNISSNIWGLNSSSDPSDVSDNSADWVDYKTYTGSAGAHNTTYDSFYEIKIPLSTLGITKSQLESNGIGAMLVATRGESALDCIPFDKSMLDNATGDYSADPSTSAEKDDIDVITADFAKIGNGTITPPPTDDLELNFGANKSAPQLAGTALTLKGIAEGGKAPYTYKFYVDGKSVGTKSGSGETSVSWTPSAAGTYVIKCVVTDAEGNSATSAKYYEVEKSGSTTALSVTAKASATTVEKGKTVKFTATATGGSGSYKYSYIVKNETTGEWARLKDNVTSSTYTWTAGSAGTRVFYVDVTDSTGKTVRSAGITVKTTAPTVLKVTAKASATTVEKGKTVKFTATATGGSGSYKYSYIVHNTTTGKWSRLKDNVTSSTYTWTAGSAGTRIFYVDVTDSTGKTVRSTGITVKTTAPATLKATAKASATSNVVGDKVTFTVTASGGSGSYKYSYIVKNETTGKWSRLKDNVTSNKFTWTAGSEGTRSFYVDVTDSAGKTVRTSAIKVVTKATDPLTVVGSATDFSLSVGETTTIIGTADGGTGSYTYSFVVYNAATESWYRYDFGSSSIKSWKATSAGTRKFYVEAKDSSGKVVRSEAITITVKK